MQNSTKSQETRHLPFLPPYTDPFIRQTASAETEKVCGVRKTSSGLHVWYQFWRFFLCLSNNEEITADARSASIHLSLCSIPWTFCFVAVINFRPSTQKRKNIHRRNFHFCCHSFSLGPSVVVMDKHSVILVFMITSFFWIRLVWPWNISFAPSGKTYIWSFETFFRPGCGSQSNSMRNENLSNYDLYLKKESAFFFLLHQSCLSRALSFFWRYHGLSVENNYFPSVL